MGSGEVGSEHTSQTVTTLCNVWDRDGTFLSKSRKPYRRSQVINRYRPLAESKDWLRVSSASSIQAHPVWRLRRQLSGL